jgi:hypothetical protein
VQPEETSTVRQRLSKHVPAATNTQATTEELLETVFSVGFTPRLYNNDPRPAEVMTDCGIERVSLKVGSSVAKKGVRL